MATLATVAGIYLKPQVPGEFGLPKHAVREAEVLASGLRGDFNNYRQEELHGDPDSAILLMPEEVLSSLRSEGWPVRPGDLGENLLLRGVRYEELAPGHRLRVGAAVSLTTTRACDPCDRLATLPYVGKERGPAFVKTMLHRRGWYARVVGPGPVRVGDPVAFL
jgi:MOSC domain-containing protein YiiM